MSDLIALIETLAANALPAKHATHLDGWRLRYNDGVTRRANSVLAERAGALPLMAKLERAETFYQDLAAPARFQLSPASQPATLDDALAGRGYLKEAGAHVQIALVNRVISQVEETADASRDNTSLLQTPDLAWLRIYEAVEWQGPEEAKLRRAMLSTLSGEVAFALARLDGEPAAVGLGVYENNFLGIFNMATHPDFRRRGAATKVLSALAHWAKAKGANQLYLQVASQNDGARAAYERAGFTTLYNYHYRTKEVVRG